MIKTYHTSQLYSIIRNLPGDDGLHYTSALWTENRKSDIPNIDKTRKEITSEKKEDEDGARKEEEKVCRRGKDILPSLQTEA